MKDLCVVGLGYVGLPTATLFARAGLKVHGADVNTRIVEAVAAGRCPIEEPGLPEIIGDVVPKGLLSASAKPVPSKAFIVAVGTPVDDADCPNLSYVKSAAEAIGTVLAKGNLVVLESTVPPGTTQGPFRQWLEAASGLKAGEDFHLCHCAERMIPGSAIREMTENDRQVGGIDPASTEKGMDLYRRMVTKGALLAVDALTSETTKLAENTYRDINIAFANELANICEAVGADVWAVIQMANRHPRVHVHQPGPGVGGHCIPVVPWFLAAAAGTDGAKFIRTARAINLAQAEKVASRAAAAAKAAGRSQPVVALLGVAYKAGIDDSRESPATPIADALEKIGCTVRLSDPWVKRFARPLVTLEEACKGADVVVVLTEEKAYQQLDPATVRRLVRTPIVYDTRNILDPASWRAGGFEVLMLGRGAAEASKSMANGAAHASQHPGIASGTGAGR